MPAAPPSGSTFATALPVRLRVSARRWVRPGSAAVSVMVCASRPTIHRTTRATSQTGETCAAVVASWAHPTPVRAGSTTRTRTTATAAPTRYRSRDQPRARDGSGSRGASGASGSTGAGRSAVSTVTPSASRAEPARHLTAGRARVQVVGRSGEPRCPHEVVGMAVAPVRPRGGLRGGHAVAFARRRHRPAGPGRGVPGWEAADQPRRLRGPRGRRLRAPDAAREALAGRRGADRARSVDAPSYGGRLGGAALLPPRLLLLPQPQELGRLQRPPRRAAHPGRRVALPRALAGRPAPPPARRGRRRVDPDRRLRVVPDVGDRLLRGRGRADRPGAPGRGVHRRHVLGLDPRDGLLLRDPVARPLPPAAAGLRGSADEHGDAHAGALHGPARPAARASLGAGRVRPDLGVREPPRR